jgi:transposase
MDGAYFLFCGAPQKRKGLDSLDQLCREKRQDDPMSGCLFLFRNRRGDTIIALCYDGQGLWHCRKRLSKGRFRFWVEGSGGGIAQVLEAAPGAVAVGSGRPGHCGRSGVATDPRKVVLQKKTCFKTCVLGGVL